MESATDVVMPSTMLITSLSRLTVSIAFLSVGLLGALVLVVDLWVKNAGVESQTDSHSTTTTNGSAQEPPTIDGMVGEAEYAHQVVDELTGMMLHWTLVGDRVFMAVTSPGLGWIAVGLDPDGPIMNGADYWMGYVLDGETVFEDHWGDSAASHTHDTEVGGSDDILAFAGSESEDSTTIEFERLILTDDAFDKPMPNGEVFVQLAYSTKDDWTTYHGSKTRNTVTVDFFATGGD